MQSASGAVPAFIRGRPYFSTACCKGLHRGYPGGMLAHSGTDFRMAIRVIERQDSNLLPTGYEPAALPNELLSKLQSVGIEPTTCGLNIRCSTAELTSPCC